MSSTPSINNEELMDICVRFMAGYKATEVRDYVNALWRRRGSDRKITREQVYPNLALACKRGLMALTPELHQLLAHRVAAKFGFEESDIKVISCRKDLAAVASATAQIALEQIEILGKLKKPKERVHVGVGAGRTSSLVCQYLASALQQATQVPPLTLHAISSGFDVEEPEKSPVSYFGYFRPSDKDIEFVGLFAPAAVKADAYDDIKESPGVKEAFRLRPKIDLVITSFASATDEHGDLNRFHRVVRGSRPNSKTRVGDVQYRSYSAAGPIHDKRAMRAVTLFELEDLVGMASQNNKRVLLVAGPCGFCNEIRDVALRPLIENPKLKVWNQLVLDLDTAEAILR